LAELRGADPAAVRALRAHAEAAGLTVVEEDAGQRRLVLSGPASAVQTAFGVTLQHFDHPDGSYRSHLDPVVLPPELAASVVAVVGLDTRQQADYRFRPAAAPGVSYPPGQVAAAYGFPTGLDGSGQAIAFIELGGGYVEADLATYFSGRGLATPKVSAVPVDGGSNSPGGGANGPDGEVMLDLEVAGSVANGAALVVYFAPNTDQGFIDAVSAAVHDSTNRPSVISISWGGPEGSYSSTTRQAFENALTDAALAGVTVCAAAGDNGSSDGATDGTVNVDYPASSPQVLGCGGTSLHYSGGRIVSEVVWNDGSGGGATGGGVSTAFAQPSWQSGVGVPPVAGGAPGGSGGGRGVPDVAGNADPATGYDIRVDGTDTVVGGTSAVAPLWAGLITLAVQSAGRGLGLVNPVLYQHFGRLPALTTGFRDITSGDNGAYRAGPGWDACTGLGSPLGSVIVKTLVSAVAPAGSPGSTPAPSSPSSPDPSSPDPSSPAGEVAG
jgi:kumamolisin